MQEDVLRRAAADSLANRAALARMLAREEEVKARATASRDSYDGPSLRWRSRGVPVTSAQGRPAADAAGEAGPSAPREAAGAASFVERSEIELVKTSLAQAPDLFLMGAPRAHMRVPHGLVIDSHGVARPRTTRAAAAPEQPRARDAQYGWDLSTVDWGAPRAAYDHGQRRAQAVQCAVQQSDGAAALYERPRSSSASGAAPQLAPVALMQRPGVPAPASGRASPAQGHVVQGGAELSQAAAAALQAGRASGGPGDFATPHRNESAALLQSGFSKRGRRTTPSDRRQGGAGEVDAFATQATPHTPLQFAANGQQAMAAQAHAPAPGSRMPQQAMGSGLQRQMLYSQPHAPARVNGSALEHLGNAGQLRGLNGEQAAPALARIRDAAAQVPRAPLLQHAAQGQHLQQFAPAAAPAGNSHSAMLHQQALQLLQRHQQAQFQLSLQQAARAQASVALAQQAANQEAPGAHPVYAHGVQPAPLMQHGSGGQPAAPPVAAQSPQLLGAPRVVQQHGGGQGYDPGVALQECDPG